MKRRWVLVVVLGDGPLEDVHVYGPWRSEAKALDAQRRMERIVDHEDYDGPYSPLIDVTELSPEHGSAHSLAALLRALRRGGHRG